MKNEPNIGEAGMFKSLQHAGFFDIDAPARTGDRKQLTCPNCSSSRRKASDKCLTMTKVNEGYTIHCHHASCNWGKGVFISDGTGKQWEPTQYAGGQQQQYRPRPQQAMPAIEKKQYQRPRLREQKGKYSKTFLDFFAGRGIGLQTLLLAGVIESEEYFGSLGGNSPAAVFPLIHDGELLSYKFRAIPEKTFAIVKNSELAMLGAQSLCAFKGTGKKVKVCIVEGEIDYLTLLELGICTMDGSNGFIALSVPNGAKSLSCLQKHFDCKDFDAVDKFLMLTDNDVEGLKMREEFARRVGVERCLLYNYPEGIKDVNELHCKHKGAKGWGAAQFLALVREVVPPIKGIDTVEDAWAGIMKIREEGHPQYKKVGIEELDGLFTWHLGGQLTALSAAPNSGKTDFLVSTSIRLAHLHGAKIGIMSPETGSAAELYDTIAKSYLGKLTSRAEAQGQPIAAERLGVATDDEFMQAMKFVAQHFFAYSCEDAAMRTEQLLATAEQLVQRHGINMLFVDPYNFLEDAFSDPQNAREMMSEHLNKNLQKIKHWAYKLDVHVVLVPHPKALAPFVPMEDYGQINGGAAWGNKCDNVIFLNRLFPGKGSEERMERAKKKQHDDLDQLLGDNVEVVVRKVKKRYAGRVGTATLAYRIATGQFGEPAEDIGAKTAARFLETIAKANNQNSAYTYAGGDEMPF